MPSAEIIQINATAHTGKGGNVGDDHIIVGLGDHMFQHLDTKPLWLQPKPVQLPF
jgi:hypothetical protein